VRRGDAVFAALARGSGIVLLAIMAAIAAFLLLQAIPAIAADHTNFLTTLGWDPDSTPATFGIGSLAFGSVLTSLLALLMGVPVAIGVALVTSHYAPRWIATPLGYMVDLLAAVPSVVFGLWGLVYLVPAMIPLSRLLSRFLGFIPLFASDGTFGKSVFGVGVGIDEMGDGEPGDPALRALRCDQRYRAGFRSRDRRNDRRRPGALGELPDQFPHITAGR
jgi:phosphate transport system permease protein